MDVLLLLIGVFACATSVIFIQESSVPAPYLSAVRLLLASVLLLPIFVRSIRKTGRPYTLAAFKRAFWPALMLSLHFITWTTGARLTDAANATLIVNLAPLAMPFIMYFLARELITGMEIVGTLIALAGVILLTANDYRFGGQTLMGDLVCFVAMVLVTIYLALARKARGDMSLWMYVVPMYALAGVICFAAGLVLAGPPKVYALKEWGLLLCLAAIPTVVGHSLLNRAMRHMRGQTVTLLNLAQFIFAAGLAYWRFGQKPKAQLYIAGGMIITGAVLAIRSAAALAARAEEMGACPTAQPSVSSPHPPTLLTCVDDLQE